MLPSALEPPEPVEWSNIEHAVNPNIATKAAAANFVMSSSNLSQSTSVCGTTSEDKAATTSAVVDFWWKSGGAGLGYRARLNNLKLLTPDGVTHSLNTLGRLLADDNLFNDTGRLANDCLLGSLSELENLFAEGVGRRFRQASDWAALSPDCLGAEADLFLDRPLNHEAADLRGAGLHLPLADLKLLFRKRDRLALCSQ